MDDEPLFLLMMLVHDEGPHGVSIWKAVLVEGHGYALTREQAEAVVSREGPGARFLYAYGDDTAYLGPRGGSAPPLTMPPSSTIWDYGEPARVDMIEVLRAAWAAGAGAAGPPVSDAVSIDVASVIEIAAQWFGSGDAHRVEAAFDVLVMDLDGNRHGAPACYGVPTDALGLR